VDAIPFLSETERIQAVGTVNCQDSVEMIDLML